MIETDASVSLRRSDGQAACSVQVVYFDTWAESLEPAADYLTRLPQLELRSRVSDPADASLMRKARLDCDWYGENLRCFAAMRHPRLQVSSAHVCGPAGLPQLLKLRRGCGEDRWLIMMAHQPQSLGAVAGKALALVRQSGMKVLYYAFDEASRFMPCFRDVAPHMDVLIHDESPLDSETAGALRPECVRIHRSWGANFLPFSVPFNETPEPKILFLGSQLGLTDHRRRQIAYLQRRFQDRFVPSHDHSVGIAERNGLNRYKVGLCPEGRKFTTPAMSRTHTDRPFWSGCLGMVPVSENSKAGDRLDDLAAAGLIVRYPHGDLEALGAACERALETPNDVRRRIYEHFNANETIGAVVANAIASASCAARP